MTDNLKAQIRYPGILTAEMLGLKGLKTEILRGLQLKYGIKTEIFIFKDT